jgi:hypothetical protein
VCRKVASSAFSQDNPPTLCGQGHDVEAFVREHALAVQHAPAAHVDPLTQWTPQLWPSHRRCPAHACAPLQVMLLELPLVVTVEPHEALPEHTTLQPLLWHAIAPEHDDEDAHATVHCVCAMQAIEPQELGPQVTAHVEPLHVTAPQLPGAEQSMLQELAPAQFTATRAPAGGTTVHGTPGGQVSVVPHEPAVQRTTQVPPSHAPESPHAAQPASCVTAASAPASAVASTVPSAPASGRTGIPPSGTEPDGPSDRVSEAGSGPPSVLPSPA